MNSEVLIKLQPKRQWWPTALHEVMLQSKEILPMDAARNQTILP